MHTPEQQRQYDELVAVIVKAVQSANDPGHYIAHDGKIWLEDVLRALQTEFPAIWRYMCRQILEYWSLGKPLFDQSDECKEFLHSLLV